MLAEFAPKVSRMLRGLAVSTMNIQNRGFFRKRIRECAIAKTIGVNNELNFWRLSCSLRFGIT